MRHNILRASIESGFHRPHTNKVEMWLGKALYRAEQSWWSHAFTNSSISTNTGGRENCRPLGKWLPISSKYGRFIAELDSTAGVPCTTRHAKILSKSKEMRAWHTKLVNYERSVTWPKWQSTRPSSRKKRKKLSRWRSLKKIANSVKNLEWQIP